MHEPQTENIEHALHIQSSLEHKIQEESPSGSESEPLENKANEMDEKLGESGGSNSPPRGGVDDIQNAIRDPDETDAQLKEYAEEFERQGEEPIKWWFAARVIPLFAATVGPMANLTAVAALVSPLRASLPTNGEYAYDERHDTPYPDPRWVIGINAVSLSFGVVGNFFLMCNYSRRLRYSIAIPLSIVSWFMATSLLSAVLISIHVYHPPLGPAQVYTQAFWFGVISAGLYFLCAVVLAINIAGYLWRKYPREVQSSKAEMSLMLHTVFFFIWLGIGALAFSKAEGWSYPDGVYFCNVTLLTVGFGDFAATSDLTRGLILPFSVIGIIMLGLIVNNIHGFVVEIGAKNVVGQHIENRRKNIADRAVANSLELSRKDPELAEIVRENANGASGNFQLKHTNSIRSIPQTVIAAITGKLRSRPILLRASRDRFEAMRRIQRQTLAFKRWAAFVLSMTAFLFLWLLGALVFMFAERHTQHLTYFQALYFCYVSILTVGYGDLSPRSNAGKAFFLLWSIWSVPAITVLISSMGSTVIEQYHNLSCSVANYTIMPEKGMRDRYKGLAINIKDKVLLKAQMEANGNHKPSTSTTTEGRRGTATSGGIPVLEGIPEEGGIAHFHRNDTEEDLRPLPQDYTFQQLLVAVGSAIRCVGRDLTVHPKRAYTYEEWVEFTRLIRACEIVKPHLLKGIKLGEEIPEDQIDDDEGFVLWDWIGEESPLLHEGNEPAWVHDRLTWGLDQLVQDHVENILVEVPGSNSEHGIEF
ncbi:hypothetical protein DRE_00301 [Drechslerella stenobrocha 248]|uniref:Potassium channel domain-containing protein n=1 Tax=Drechslerella stenobrocha 248 TaxID=1043628 RepID=W7I570_9PEZI|nr:hypothetical protein DRE_00301 [Drechslerella stenobrocha 248]